MGRITYKNVYCCRSNTKYRVVFEEYAPDKWIGVRAEGVTEVGYFEKQHLIARANGKLTAQTVASGGDGEIEMKEFSMGEVRCPTCGADNFSGCGGCNQLTCFSWSWNLENVTCAVCKFSYPLKGAGTITSLKASEVGGNGVIEDFGGANGAPKK